jgi:tyrosyl-tRNA synthetase
LFDRMGCRLQMGGSDQWGNIVAGIELIRRVRQHSAFGITFPLITTSTGAKMGKTAKGAVWLDPARTTPYDYYQFWVNTDDGDVTRFLSLFTFLPIEEILQTTQLQNADLNGAKSVLAFEATSLAHGIDEATNAYRAAAGVFGARKISEDILPSSAIPRQDKQLNDQSMPQSFMNISELKNGIPIFKFIHSVGLAGSGGAARRLVAQGGAYVNGIRIEDLNYQVTEKDIVNDEIMLCSGKKRFHKIKFRLK